MRVLHVIGSISRSAGGPSRSCQGLVAGARVVGVDAWLMTLGHGEEPWIRGVEKFVNGGDFSAALDRIQPDIVHVHGIWSPALHKCVLTCRARGIPYVIAPRGMLEPWSLKQKWLKKRIARWLYQDRDLKKAAALHATAESEAEQFRKLGFKNYCIVSPNGVNLPEGKVERVGGISPDQRESRSERYAGCGQRRALFVSRMHQKKGVLELVESWGRIKPQGWLCELVYTLNGDEEKAYEAKVKARVLELGLSDQFIFTGALDDDKKWDAYARANLFVLPTYSENFGIVVAEALWAGVPVITTKGTPWQELESRKCGWWIDLPTGNGLAKWDALDAALVAATTRHSTPTPTPSTLTSLSSMGENGHRLVEEKYTWKAVCKAMVEGYEKILGKS